MCLGQKETWVEGAIPIGFTERVVMIEPVHYSFSTGAASFESQPLGRLFALLALRYGTLVPSVLLRQYVDPLMNSVIHCSF